VLYRLFDPVDRHLIATALGRAPRPTGEGPP